MRIDEPLTDSSAYLCFTCGEVWMRIERPGGRWFAVHRSCRRHPLHSTEVAGSLITWGFSLNDMTPEQVCSEFEVHLAHWDRHGGMDVI